MLLAWLAAWPCRRVGFSAATVQSSQVALDSKRSWPCDYLCQHPCQHPRLAMIFMSPRKRALAHCNAQAPGCN